MQLDRKIYGLWNGLIGMLRIYPEHGEDGFLQKVNKYQLHYEALHPVRGEFRPRQTRQLPRAVDLKGQLLGCQSY